jgi:hypothetical protein
MHILCSSSRLFFCLLCGRLRFPQSNRVQISPVPAVRSSISFPPVSPNPFLQLCNYLHFGQLSRSEKEEEEEEEKILQQVGHRAALSVATPPPSSFLPSLFLLEKYFSFPPPPPPPSSQIELRRQHLLLSRKGGGAARGLFFSSIFRLQGRGCSQNVYSIMTCS